MKYVRSIVLTWVAVLCLLGCGKEVYIENQRFMIAEGIDLDEDNKFVIYTASPVFSREATNKYKITTATADTLRIGKKKLESRINGSFGPGKLQSILIGKKLLQQLDVLPYLDVFFRDPKNEINANMIVVDGSVKDVMYANTSDKGQLGSVIKLMVESTYKARISVLTTLQKYHQQMLDNAITPSITEMTVEKGELVITGTTLLHKDGTYATSLNNQESSLLLLLQNNTKNPIPLTFHLPSEMFHTDEEMSYVSFNINKVKVNVKSKFEGSHLTVDVLMKVQIDLMERMFDLDMEQQSRQLERAIAEELKKECQDLIKKARKNQVYPFGLGIYVRSHDYKNWKKIEDNWGQVISDAIINISTQVNIKSIGVSK
jgi:Ger(x)C family germination protein